MSLTSIIIIIIVSGVVPRIVRETRSRMAFVLTAVLGGLLIGMTLIATATLSHVHVIHWFAHLRFLFIVELVVGIFSSVLLLLTKLATQKKMPEERREIQLSMQSTVLTMLIIPFALLLIDAIIFISPYIASIKLPEGGSPVW